jgi:hypothetical protein
MKIRLLLVIGLFMHGYVYSNHSDTLLIKKQLEAVTGTHDARSYPNNLVLDSVAAYIFSEFEQYADTTYYQTYYVNEVAYSNVICVFGSQNLATIVVGAHYDVCGKQEGADDNASGVVGLLELARILKDDSLKYRIEMVAYTLEEPPFFRTKAMGSYIHALSLVEDKKPVFGMVCLEMIGYFSDAKKSQDYPLKFLSLFYGNKGNYITVVNKWKKGKLAKSFTKGFKNVALIRTKKFTAPSNLPGIDFSDHLNYWNLGFSAIMITDTGFFRNKNYHENTDTLETLDIYKMSLVIDGVYETLIHLK